MIPALDASGNLPPGVHGANWPQVRVRFGRGAYRRQLLHRVEPALHAFKEAGCVTVYLAGSFVSCDPFPGDIDILWEPHGVDTRVLDLHSHLLADGSPRARFEQRERFGAEFIPQTVPRDGPPFLDFFQTEKGTDAPRGIVRLDLRNFPVDGSDNRRHDSLCLPISWAKVIDVGPNGLCPQGTFPHAYQQGETFFLLAQRFHTTVAAIRAANPGVDPYNLQPGMVLCIPDR